MVRKIYLSGKLGAGKFVLVDDEDYEKITEHKWYLGKCGYVRRTNWVEGKSFMIRMHREIMDAKKGEIIDHINRNKLDNRRNNLRFCNNSENGINQTGRKNFTSNFKGVHWDKNANLWVAAIGNKSKTLKIGRFENELDAAYAYNQKALKLFGEFAFLNKIPEKHIPKPKKSRSSKYIGVSKVKNTDKYTTQTKVNGKNIYIGISNDEVKAALLYNKFVVDNNLDKSLNIIEGYDETC